MEFIERSKVDYRVEGRGLDEIINYNEYLVLKAMRELYRKDPSLCRCPICVEDAYALALNLLPPRYIQVTSSRTYETSRHYIGEEEVRARVLESIVKVKENPNHSAS